MPDKPNPNKTRKSAAIRNCKLCMVNKERLMDCAELFRDVFKREPWNYTWLTKENTERYFTDLYKTPRFNGFCYELDGMIIGVCMGTINDYFATKFYDIKEIFIRRDAQNKGIGSAMLNDIETLLNKNGINAVSLYTQKHINAYGFYLKNGYFPSDETVYLCKILDLERPTSSN